MKVVITGANGQLASALLDQAPERFDVIGLDRSELDLTDHDAIAATISRERPNWLINAAAYTAVDKAESEPELAHAINARAVQAMVDALAQSGGRLFQISTDFVFDGLSDHPYRPEDKRNPLSVYGQTKAQGEDALRGKDLLVRTSWVYAAGKNNFVRTMLRLMRSKDRLEVVSDQIGSPSWASSLARALWALIKCDERGTFHFCDAGQVSWFDFAVEIQNIALEIGLIESRIDIVPVTSEEYVTPAKRPQYSVLDCSKFHHATRLAPVDWRANLRRMLEEEKQLG